MVDNAILPRLKHCSKCKLMFPATSEFFGPDKRHRDGLKSRCRCCIRGYNVQPDIRKQKRIRDRRHRLNKANERHTSSQRWRKDNPGKAASHTRNHNARKRAAEGVHTAADIDAQLKRQHHHCYYCQCKLTKKPHLPNSCHVDHVVPLTRGGRNDISNLVIACRDCNLSKNAKLPHEWSEGGRLL